VSTVQLKMHLIKLTSVIVLRSMVAVYSTILTWLL